MEPSQWQPPHGPAQPYPSQPAYGPPAYGQPAYGQPWPAPPPQWSPYGPPTGPPVVWAVLLWGLAVVSLVGSLIFSVIAYAGFWSNSYLDSYGVTTTATVTDVERFTDTVTVEFTSDGGTPSSAEIVWFTGDVPEVGDEVEITYDPSDPSYASEASGDPDAVMGAVFVVGAGLGLVVMVGAVVGAVLIHRRRGRAAPQRAPW
ncbi:DUF3592 domain-containing protein [Mycolicibacterium gadium]|uniref:DUF3592 domain-containing protein n=1 Tax=Mycolicibacterium gadium TaxID=1794 RepID=A0ABT6GN36_MYCGU|nr:DUF3592 domain-containing protein [Mycolicibacterium gadium]MDG5482516.1 hypothetical protein [Mycolicibacterium gadium]